MAKLRSNMINRPMCVSPSLLYVPFYLSGDFNIYCCTVHIYIWLLELDVICVWFNHRMSHVSQ